MKPAAPSYTPRSTISATVSRGLKPLRGSMRYRPDGARPRSRLTSLHSGSMWVTEPSSSLPNTMVRLIPLLHREQLVQAKPLFGHRRAGSSATNS